MRIYFRFASFLLLIGLAACQKVTTSPCGEGYKSATVMRGRNGCDQNGFLLQLDGSTTLAPDSLPAAFQQPGLKVCLTYSTYEDLRMCACCGGTRVSIQHIRLQ